MTLLMTALIVVGLIVILPLVWNVGAVRAIGRQSQNSGDAAALAAAESVARELTARGRDRLRRGRMAAARGSPALDPRRDRCTARRRSNAVYAGSPALPVDRAKRPPRKCYALLTRGLVCSLYGASTTKGVSVGRH